MKGRAIMLILLVSIEIIFANVIDTILPPQVLILRRDETASTHFMAPAPANSRLEDSIYYCSLDNYGGVGLNSGDTLTWEAAIRLTPVQLAPYSGWYIIALAWYHFDGSSPYGAAKIYDQGTSTQPGPLLHSTTYSGGVNGWQRIDLSTPVPINGATDMWCSIELNTPPGGNYYPAGVDAGPPIADANWLYINGYWGTLPNVGLPYNWNFLCIVSDQGKIAERIGPDGIKIPFGFAPNTFSSTRGSTITYTITRDSKVILRVFDATGKLVNTLVNKRETAGTKRVYWETQHLPNGIYFLRLEAEGKATTAKIVLIR